MSTPDMFETKVCTASWMDGLSIDIIAYSEIGPLTEQQVDKLWADHTDIAILRLCDEAFMFQTGEIDEVPGQSDEFFVIMTDDEKALKAELREKIMEIVSG